jgi:hypothetical protein
MGRTRLNGVCCEKTLLFHSLISLLDDSLHRSRDGSRDPPMPGIPLCSTSDADFQSQLDKPATDPGVAAAAVVCDALVRKNMASVMDLQPLMPVLQTILHPDYLSGLCSGLVQIPVVPQMPAVATTPPSSPGSIMLGSQILNTRRDAQEVQARLNAARHSNKRQWPPDDSTGDKEDSSRNPSPRRKKRRSNGRNKRNHHSRGETPNPNQPRRQQQSHNNEGAETDIIRKQ